MINHETFRYRLPRALGFIQIVQCALVVQYIANLSLVKQEQKVVVENFNVKSTMLKLQFDRSLTVLKRTYFS